MKKFLLTVVLIFLALQANAAQGDQSGLVKLGYKSNPGRLAFGIEGRYFLTDHIRVAPDVTVLFPKNHITGLDVNINFHYFMPIQEDAIAIYPLAGPVMINNRMSYKGKTSGSTRFGFNLGLGGQYAINENGYLNLEFKYTFAKDDGILISAGYGFNF